MKNFRQWISLMFALTVMTVSRPSAVLGQFDFFGGVSDIPFASAETADAYYDGSTGNMFLAIGANVNLLGVQIFDPSFGGFGPFSPTVVRSPLDPAPTLGQPADVTTNSFGYLEFLALLPEGIFNLGSILPAGAQNAFEFRNEIAFGGDSRVFFQTAQSDVLLNQINVIASVSALGDFDDDGDVDADDVDSYSGKIGHGIFQFPELDLDGDELITLADHDQHVENLVQTPNGSGTFIGDLNLDGDVDVSQIVVGPMGIQNFGDAAIMLANLGTPSGAGYADGDLNADGDVDVSQISIGPGGIQNLGDAARLLANLGSTVGTGGAGAAPGAHAVPEPGSLSLMLLGAVGMAVRRRKQD